LPPSHQRKAAAPQRLARERGERVRLSLGGKRAQRRREEREVRFARRRFARGERGGETLPKRRRVNGAREPAEVAAGMGRRPRDVVAVQCQ
jgi:hypothetical protein